ncbi:FMN-dependent NADH-azoreductase [Aquabacterium sp. A08]|uniref:FMN-dependent NADH-azoreductase n=1 Tax=Aquabacterium sp. A08 TaxID=2718532 RepID=UPI001420F564|nr:NAD(P)H-dependent oxidoreductase [Aquabacterium sp. A08]NIC41330.1 FMN-dependent NADH-azoreductase [Aquabacterium sp. A08]NIC41365.1 FMN-dependent NADH-azoreductase [Aquabacterium sp. A08]
MKILQIHASPRRGAANSSKVAHQVVAALQARHAGAQVTLRDLADHPVTVLDEAALGALFTPADQRSAAQAAVVAEYDALIAEVQAHDTLVLGVPMYNFGVPVQLKAWIDAIARAGVTFRYTDQGPQGLLQGKTVYLALARGGLYRDQPHDTQVPYLKTVLGFLGLTDVRPIYAEGLNMGPEAAARGFAQAEADLAAALA